MSSNMINVDAQSRSDYGKGASRRLRRTNMVPAIIYGGDDGANPQPIQLPHNEVQKHLSNDAFYSQLLMVSIDGAEPVRSILRDVQRHPFKQQIMHMDFQRVVAGAELTVNVPIHFINEDICVGVKTGGGIINHIENELAVSCRPRDIPEFVEVDMAEVDLGQAVHISDIKLPEGVRSVDLSQGEDHDRSIAAVAASRATVEADDETEGDETPEGDSAESDSEDTSE